MKKESKFSFPSVGGSSLIVIFSVLCLTVFALLAISTVQASGRLSDASAEAVSGYYEADCAAEEILARIRLGEVPEGVSTEGDLYYYTCPVSDTQQLAVAVRVRGGEYTVLCWQAVSTTDWEPDDSIKVWDGETGIEEEAS